MVPVVPDIDWAGHLVDYLFEFGPTKAENPLDAENILAIQKVLGVKFDSWESRLLIRLSREYLGEVHGATKPDAKPPYEPAARQWRRVGQAGAEARLDAFLK